MASNDELLTLVDLYTAETSVRADKPRRALRRATQRIERRVGPGVSKAVAARMLGVSTTTLDKWITRGLVRTVRVPLRNGGEKEMVERRNFVVLAAQVERLRETGMRHGVLAAAIHAMQREDPRYQREAADLYGEALDAMRTGDLVSAEPGPDWHPDD